uniref:Endonuclease/exonuclease/phosphatase domain-containing protein n=1 Tax=Latimeria chalumnae TaxID=7897 RepID=H3A762_LATCH
GVLIRFHKNLPVQTDKEFRDEEGRVLILVGSVSGFKLTIANIYVSNDPSPSSFAMVQMMLLEVQDLPLILEDSCFDRSQPEISRRPPPDRTSLQMLISHFGLVDIWRLVNPQVSEFTFRLGTHHTKTRIDFFLISKSLVNLVKSDHAPVDLTIWRLEDLGKRGRWRLNVALLQSDSLKEEIEQIIKEFLELNMGSVATTATLWDAAKAYFQGRLIAISFRIKKARVQRARDLERHIKELESRD